MTPSPQTAHRRSTTPAPLHGELLWFTRLRWLAAAAILLFGAANLRFLHWYDHAPGIVAVGCAVLLYNAATILALHHLPHLPHRRRPLRLLAWLQLVLDLLSLSLLTVWTGGVYSPIRGFFVFHMIFAALLLPRAMAYATAALALLALSATLSIYHRFPADRDALLVFGGTTVMLTSVVYLTARMARSLRTQRRQLLRQNRRIRKISRQLTRHQEAVAQQEKMFALGQMAAGVTHEIANPLAAIDSVLQLLHRKPERFGPDTVDKLRQQVQRVFQIIQQMKNFAHPAETERDALPLNDVVQQALDIVRFDPRAKPVKIEPAFSPDLSSADLVPQSLQQVLINLLVNALDAVHARPDPRVIVRTAAKETHYTVEVIDNGHGIRPEHLSRLFEPFFTTKPVGTGTGLGLSISYKLIERQGGRITVRSDLGVGTTFTVRLPRPNAPSRKREGAPRDVVASEKSPA